MCSIDPATTDKRCWLATGDNHREPLRPVPTDRRPLPLLQSIINCLLHRGLRVECGGRQTCLVARLRFRWDSTTFYQYVGLSKTVCTPSLGTETTLQFVVCSQQPTPSPTHHPSFLIMRRSVIRPESKPRPWMHAAGWSNRPGR